MVHTPAEPEPVGSPGNAEQDLPASDAYPDRQRAGGFTNFAHNIPPVYVVHRWG